jgi:RimJ/RimL family protein N-acetyltransferase
VPTLEPRAYTLKSGERAIVRSPLPEDAARMRAITVEAMGEGQEYHITEADEFPFSVEQMAGWVTLCAASESNLLLVAEVDGEVQGGLNFDVGERRRTRHAGTVAMSVDARWREHGLGFALMDALLRWAEGQPQIERVGLSVLSSNTRARRLYEKMGFVEEGRRVRALKLAPDRYVDEVLMARAV